MIATLPATKTAFKSVPMSVDDLVNPNPNTRETSVAKGGTAEPLPKLGDVDDEQLGLTLHEEGGLDSLLKMEAQVSARWEMIDAAERTLEAVRAKGVPPDQLRPAVRATAAERAKTAGRLHAAVESQSERLSRKEHTLVRHHYSFLAEAGIAAEDVATRSRVKLLISPGSLADHPGFGTRFCAPLAGELVIHTGVFGLIATTAPIRTAHQLTLHGRVCKESSTILFAPLPTNRLESLDQMQLGKDGEEHVALVSAPIRSTPDIVLEGSLALAGKYFGDLIRGGFGTNVTGLDPRAAVSDAYLTPPLPPFVNDFHGRAAKLPGGVVVGASGTDGLTMDRLLHVFMGIHVAAARRGTPELQVSVGLANQYLRRVLKVAGHTLLPLPPSDRKAGVETLQKMLREQLTGPLPRMFKTLTLIIDIVSAEGQEAARKGGLLLKVVVEVNSRLEAVQFTIEVLTEPPVPKG